MHIAIDAREWSSTTGRYISRLVRELEQLDTENDYSILLYPKDMDRWEPQNPRFTKVPCPHKEFSFDEQLGFRHQLNGLKPDLVHFGMVQQPVFYRGTTVTTLNDLTTLRFYDPTKNPLVFTVKQWVYKWVNKRVARKASALITYTEYVKQDVIDYTGVSADKFTVTPLAAEPISEPAEPVGGLENTPFIMYVGRPLPHKNLPRLIEAYQQLQVTHPDLKLVLAGRKDAGYQKIEERAREQHTEGIIFTDYITDAQLRWLYEHCTAYVFPSLSEGFGLPGLEAMVQGAPVISSNATCLPEVYGDAAVYFDPTDPTDIAKTIAQVIDKPDLREELIEKGAQQAAKYSWKQTAEKTLAVYTLVGRL